MRKALWQSALNAEAGQRPFVFVAETEKQGLVGFAAAGAPLPGAFPWEKELYAIYLLKSAQGKGVGRALLKLVCGSLSEINTRSLGLWVLEENRQARRFYERYGAVVRGEHAELEEGTEIVDVAMGWDDLAGLAERFA